MAADARRRRRPGRRIWWGLGGGLVVLTAAVVAASTTMSSSPGYRLAAVTTGVANPTLTEVGTLQPVNQSTVSFPISGQVQTVDVQVGQNVGAGQQLATLNTSSLTAQLDTAQASVATAQARLTADQDSQTTAVTAATTPTGGGTGAGAGGGTSKASPSPATTQLTQLQHALVADQKALDVAMPQSQQALATVTKLCPPGTTPSSGTGGKGGPTTSPRSTPSVPPPSSHSPSPSPSASPSASPSSPRPTPSGSPTGPGGPDTTCPQAESDLLGWEYTVYQDEQAVSKDEGALTTALEKATSGTHTSTGSGTGSGSGAGAGAGSGGSGGSGSGGTHTTSAPATADQIAADQASVDAATANQQSAQQNLDQAKLLSPEAGLIRSVSLSVGSSVSANSSTATVVISSTGGEEVVMNIPVTNLSSISQGEKAKVVPDGSSTAYTGTVSSIGVLPASGTTPTYPVTIALDGGTDLPDGASATVSLLPGTATGTSLVVPTSAVNTRGRQHTVLVYSKGKVTTVTVTVGDSGPIYTQITGGLSAGQQVVVADLGTPLPTTTANPGRGLTGGGGGFVGGGGGGGGGANRGGGGGTGRTGG